MEILPDKIKHAIDLEVNTIMHSAHNRQIIRSNLITEKKIFEDHEAASTFREAMEKLAKYIYNKGVVEGAAHAAHSSGLTFITAAKSRVENFEKGVKSI